MFIVSEYSLLIQMAIQQFIAYSDHLRKSRDQRTVAYVKNYAKNCRLYTLIKKTFS